MVGFLLVFVAPLGGSFYGDFCHLARLGIGGLVKVKRIVDTLQFEWKLVVTLGCPFKWDHSIAHSLSQQFQTNDGKENRIRYHNCCSVCRRTLFLKWHLTPIFIEIDTETPYLVLFTFCNTSTISVLRFRELKTSVFL